MYRIAALITLLLILSTPVTATAEVAEVETIAYPRLAMWYPGVRWNTWADVAQFDLFVGDFNETGGFLDRNTIYSAPISIYDIGTLPAQTAE